MNKKSKIRTKLIKKHIKDCLAMKQVNEGSWNTPWYFPNKKSIKPIQAYRDKRGGKTGSSEIWLILRCCSLKCEAELLVHELDLLEFLEKEIF